MIYIATALALEARPIIDYYGLKRDNKIKKIQVFKNDDIVLMITGTGILKSAIAVTHILTIFDIKRDDLFLNIGVCGAVNDKYKIGEIIFVNRIKNSITGRNWYPEVVFKHDFKEGYLETYSNPIYSKENLKCDIVDMEGAGLIEAISLFFESYQIIFLKIISDRLEKVSAEVVPELIKNNLSFIDEYLKNRKLAFKDEKAGIDEIELEYIEIFAQTMRFTQTMKNELKELLNYFKLSGGNIKEILEEFEIDELEDKREGKRVLNEIRKRIID